VAGIGTLPAQTYSGVILDTPATYPISITGWKGGNLLINDDDNDYIYEIDSSGALGLLSFQTGISSAAGLASDLNDRIWANDIYVERIYEFNGLGAPQSNFPSPVASSIYGLTYNPNTGNLYASTPYLGSIAEMSTTGTLLNTYATGGVSPFSIAYDANRDSYWIYDIVTKMVHKYDSGFSQEASFAMTSPFTATGLAVVGNTLYITLPYVDDILVVDLGPVADDVEELPETPTPSPSAPAPKVEVNTAAMQSLFSSGLFMAYANQYAALSAANSVNHDLNDRLLRWRSMLMSQGGGGTASHQPSETQLLSKILAMSSGMNMDHRVALGLREGVDTTYHTERSLWMGSLMGMAGGQFNVPGPEVHAVTAAPLDTKNPVGKDVITEGDDSRLEIYTAGDFNAYSQDQLTNLLQGFDTDSYAGTVGLEYRLLPWLMAGAGWSYVTSDTELDHNLGGIDLDGQVLSTYLAAVWNRFYADAKYSYGGFDHSTSRDTLMGSTAKGFTNSWVHNMGLNFGYTIPVRRNFVTGPIASLDYATGGVSGYSETNGGAANVAYAGQDVESMIMQLGWQATVQHELPKARLLAQLHAGWEREFMPQSGAISASLVNSPYVLVSGASRTPFGGFDGAISGAHPGTDWLALGGAIRLNFINGWNTSLNYEAQLFRDDAMNHHAGLKVSRDF